MDELTFLFQRNPARTPEDFVEHYLDTHAVFGRTIVKGVSWYAVSLKDPDQSPLAPYRAGPATVPVDALTELTVDDLDTFYDASTRTPEEREQYALLVADHNSMFGDAQHGYVVERRVVVGAEQDWPSTTRTPGVKLLTLLEGDTDDAGDPRPGEPGVWRSRVATVLRARSGDESILGASSPGAPRLRAIAERQFLTHEDLAAFLAQAGPGTIPAGSYLLSEYLMLP